MDEEQMSSSNDNDVIVLGGGASGESAYYDVIVLGAGPVGEHCAGHLAAGGLKVAVVERELIGGECSYYACIPSKTLLRPGEALAGALAAPGAREAVTGTIDVEQALGWRDFVVSDYDDSIQQRWLGDNGIDLYRGSGRIAAPGVVAVGEQRYGTRHIVLATGSEPAIPPIPGLRELEGVWTNREATGLRELPQRLVVLGGGPVGVEMAQALARMGTSVALVEGMDHLLPREPRALGEALGEALSADGIELHFGQHASHVGFDDGEYVVSFPDGGQLKGDRLLLATGRRPRVHEIGLDAIGVEANPHGIAVDAQMSAGEGVWAIGDVTGIWPLTYVGKYQGRIAAANILGEVREANYDAVPRVVFTDPQAASVGAGEGPLTATAPISEVPKTATYTRAYEKRRGFLTLVSDGDRLTGAHALGPDAGEWMQQATLAIRAGVPIEIINDTIQPFPTFSEIFYFALAELSTKIPASVG
jgi:pyruvate/2-oxoglutarate dehydrogenase complex dihydrolipoamide dehydrogenase (E3) component